MHRTSLPVSLLLATCFLAQDALAVSFDFVTVDFPGARATYVTGLDGDSLVGYYLDDNFAERGFLRIGDAWQPLDFPLGFNTRPEGIDDGRVVGSYIDPEDFQTHGFLYEAGTWTRLDFPSPTASNTAATGVSGDKIVGTFIGPSTGDPDFFVSHGFVLDGDQWTEFEHPGAQSTGPVAVDGDRVVGSWYSSEAPAVLGFVFDGASFLPVAPPAPFELAFPTGVDGERFVGFWENPLVPNSPNGFLFDGAEYVPVDYPGANATAILGIEGGRFVGYYIDPDSFFARGFIGTIVPEPTSLGLISLAVVSCGILQRARSAHRSNRMSVRRATLATALLAVGLCERADAAAFFWDGQGATRSWSEGANWAAGAPPANNGSSDLYFGASSGGFLTVADIPGTTSFGGLFGSVVAGGEIRGMTFLPVAGAYEVGSVDRSGMRDGVVVRSGGVVNLSSSMQTFNTKIYHDTSFTSRIDGGVGGLRFNQGVGTLGDFLAGLTIAGDGPIAFEEATDFSGGFGIPPITKSGAGTVSFRRGLFIDFNSLEVNEGAVEITGPTNNGVPSRLRSATVNAGSSFALSGGARLELSGVATGLQLNSGAGAISGSNTALYAARDVLRPTPTNPLITSTIGVTGAGALTVESAARAYFDTLNVGSSDVGSLVVRTGARVDGAVAILGLNAGSSGTGTITGPSSAWTNTGDILVGASGNGLLEIRSGATVSSFRGHVGFSGGSSGSVLVTDPGSTWTAGGSMFIGNGGSGSLGVLSGAVASTAGNAYLGFSTFSQGLATVSGAGSIWNVANTFYIGGNGDGPGGPFASTAEVSSGGRVNAGSTVLYNTGILSLSDSATLNSPLTSQGGVMRLVSGHSHAGNIALEAGGLTVIPTTATATATLGGVLSGVGGLSVSGLNTGTLRLTGANTYSGPTTVSSGTLLIDGSVTSGVTVNSGATLGGVGVTGPVTLNFQGRIAPGGSIGLLNSGTTTFSGGGILGFEVRTDGAGQPGTDWDSLSVLGSLDVSALSPANPVTLELRSLTATEQPGPLGAWSPGVDHVWPSIITTTGGVLGDYAPDLIRIDASQFYSPKHGAFSIVQNGANLDLVYEATEVAEGVLVSNFAEPVRAATPIGNNPNPALPPEGLGTTWYWAAQQFVNDGLSRELVSIGARVGDAAAEPVVVARLHADDNGAIGALITEMAAPDLTGPTGERDFSPLAPVVLDPSAAYWLVLGSENPGDGTFLWEYANSNSAVGTGLISSFADSTDAGATWGYHPGGAFPYFLQVNTATPILDGDFNGDGVVDEGDYQEWLSTYGSTTQLAADGNGDGVVDAADYTIWRDSLPALPGLATETAHRFAVPEPGAAALVPSVAALAAACRSRSRKFGRAALVNRQVRVRNRTSANPNAQIAHACIDEPRFAA